MSYWSCEISKKNKYFLENTVCIEDIFCYNYMEIENWKKGIQLTSWLLFHTHFHYSTHWVLFSNEERITCEIAICYFYERFHFLMFKKWFSYYFCVLGVHISMEQFANIQLFYEFKRLLKGTLRLQKSR